MSKVKLINTRTMVPEIIKTDAESWGELKEDIQDEVAGFEDFDFNTARVIIKANGNKYTVSLDDESLPAADEFTVFLTPIKVDQGNKLPYEKAKLREIRTYLLTLVAWLSNEIGDELVVEERMDGCEEEASISEEEMEFIKNELS